MCKKNFIVSYLNAREEVSQKIVHARCKVDARVIADSWVFAEKIISIKRSELA